MRSVLHLVLAAQLVILTGCNIPVPGGGKTVGEVVPSMDLKDIYGTELKIEDYRGKLVLLNLWATWCVPCVAEMPSLERLYQTYKKKGLVILAVTVDPAASLPRVREFVKENGLSFVFPHDPKFVVPRLLGISRFPESLFIGPDGKMLTVYDPVERKRVNRIVSDRPWDSREYIQLVGSLLDEHLN